MELSFERIPQAKNTPIRKRPGGSSVSRSNPGRPSLWLSDENLTSSIDLVKRSKVLLRSMPWERNGHRILANSFHRQAYHENVDSSAIASVYRFFRITFPLRAAPARPVFPPETMSSCCKGSSDDIFATFVFSNTGHGGHFVRFIGPRKT